MSDPRGKIRGRRAGWKVELSRYRSVELYPARSRRGKAFGIVLKNRGVETRVGMSDEAMMALFRLYMRVRAAPKCVTVDYEWRVVEQPTPTPETPK